MATNALTKNFDFIITNFYGYPFGCKIMNKKLYGQKKGETIEYHNQM